MPTANLRASIIPPALAGPICIGGFNVPRFWATIWMDVLNGSLEASTKQRYLTAINRLYEAAEHQRGSDCLDRLITYTAFEDLESVLLGFLTQLRNQSAVDRNDRSSTWSTALTFVIDVLSYSGSSAQARAGIIETKIQRLKHLYSQLSPAPARPPAQIRALPPTVINDLYAIFDPNSDRNPFKTVAQRWRNLLIFMLLLRLGLRRAEAAILPSNAIKDDVDPESGRTVTWIDVEGIADHDPRYEKPGLKTVLSRRQLPVPQEILFLVDTYVQNYRGKTHYPHLLISQKRNPLSLRSTSEIFEIATEALSDAARRSLEKQGLSTVSCHDLRHTCAVVRMRRYQDAGDDLGRAMEKLRLFFGWVIETLEALPEEKRSPGWQNQISHAQTRLKNIDAAIRARPGEKPFPEGPDLHQSFARLRGTSVLNTVSMLRDAV